MDNVESSFVIPRLPMYFRVVPVYSSDKITDFATDCYGFLYPMQIKRYLQILPET